MPELPICYVHQEKDKIKVLNSCFNFNNVPLSNKNIDPAPFVTMQQKNFLKNG
jgi:hypothetical protein